MNSIDNSLRGLSHAITDVAVGQKPWSHFIECLGTVTGHALGIFYHEYIEERHTVITDVVDGDPELTRLYHEQYQHINPYLRNGGMPLPPAGSVGPLESIVPRAALEKTEFFHGFVARQRLVTEDSVYFLPFNDGRLVRSIALCRRRGQVGMEVAEVCRLIESLMPHLQTATHMSSRLAMMQLELNAVLRALDRLPQGVFLLDTLGRVLSMNAVAQRIVREKDGLTVARDGLRAAHADETRRLARLIVETGRTALGVGVAPGGVLRLQRKSMRPAYEVLVCPLSADELMVAPNRAAVAIFVSDPDSGLPPAPDVFQTLYRLTPAEARVAHLLAAGCGLVVVADELHVRRETVRTHLKSIFAKTGTSRQSQLVRLALSGPAALRQAVDR